MKKLIKSVFGLLASAALVFSSILPAFATTDYEYTVKFLAGAQGSFNKAGIQVIGDDSIDVQLSSDKSMITVSGISYGARITLDTRCVDVNKSSKYYCKGIRESGMDNNTINASSFQVNKDIDYVVGYALLADSVAYTIEYVDRNGVALAPAETHYGNVGDKPVIAFLFIDGYLPQAYNLTGTLYRDPADNIFRFVYTPLSELPYGYTGYNDLGTIDYGVTGNAGVIVIPGDGGAGGAGGQGGNAGGNGANADDNGVVNIEGDETPAAPQGPQEIIDIRDEESALSNGNGIFDGLMDNLGIKTESPSAFLTSIPTGAKIAIIGGLAAVVGVAAYFLFIRRGIKASREKKDED